jgi:pimeloyl-ACP methyl ester carboxylesterase
MHEGLIHVTARTGWSRASAALTAIAALIVLVASCSVAVSGSSTPGGSRSAGRSGGSARPSAAGSQDSAATPTQAPAGPPYPVGAREITIDDNARQIETAGHVSSRVVPTVVRYPAMSGHAGQDNWGVSAAPGAFPLVVFAPGYLQCGSAYAPLLRSWTQAGFVVAEVRFPLTGCHTASPDEADIINQPFDVSAVISQLLADSADPASPLHDLIDPHQVAVAGHSDGGDTTAAVADNTCCQDNRVSAAIVLAGAELSSFGGSYFPPGSPPTLFVQGTGDTMNLPADTKQLYEGDKEGAKALLWVDGASHLSPYEGNGPAEQLVAKVTTDFLQMTLLGLGSAAGSMVRDGNVTGRSTLTTSGMPSAAG